VERNICILKVGLIISFLTYSINNLNTVDRIKYSKPVLAFKVILKVVIYVMLSSLN